MQQQFRTFFRFLLLFSFLSLGQSNSHARPVSNWTLERISEQAEVIVVGEVVGVATTGDSILADQNKWKMPLLIKEAEIRCLRQFAENTSFDTKDGDLFSIEFPAIDIKHVTAVPDGPNFPELSVGDVYAFPLRRIKPLGFRAILPPEYRNDAAQKRARDSGKIWELVDEEDFKLLVPCIKAPLLGRHVGTKVEFLQSELVGTLALSGYSDIYRAAKYLDHARLDTLDSVCDSLDARYSKDNESRWLDIAVASYCAAGIPRPSIADLTKSDDPILSHRNPTESYFPRNMRTDTLYGKALRQLSRKDLDQRFIEVAIRHSDLHAWGTAIALSQNYRTHPATVKFMKERLNADAPGALLVASYIIKEKENPLCRTAVATAKHFLLQRAESNFYELYPPCQLIRDYGSESDFKILVGEIKKAQRENRERFLWLWQACAYDKNPRMISVYRFVIEDKGIAFNETRFCDLALGELARLTHQDFGIEAKPNPAERQAANDRAIEKAKEWLKQHPEK